MEETKVAVPAKFKDIVSKIEEMSVIELHELVKVLEEKLGKKCDIISLRVERPSLPVNPNAHISETALDDYFFDYTIINDGTKTELKQKVKEFLGAIK